MPEPPQLAPLDVEEQRFYSELLLMTELLTLSLRESPATLRRKLISAACTRDLVTIGEGRNVDRTTDRCRSFKRLK